MYGSLQTKFKCMNSYSLKSRLFLFFHIFLVLMFLSISPAYSTDLDGDGYEDLSDPDRDGDGIPNTIEEAVGLNSALAADGLLDLDSDGWRNVVEYEHGTAIDNPLDTPLNQINPHQKVFAEDGTREDGLGYVVAIDGDTAVIGAHEDDPNGLASGSAYVFTRTGNRWNQQAKLQASDGAAGDKFGFSVSVSGDTILVGALLDDDQGSNTGSVYVFTRSGNQWSQQAKLQTADGTETGFSAFGKNVSLSGNTALIAANVDFNTGGVYVFVRNGSTWSQQAKLEAVGGSVFDHFGTALSLSGDTALIGAHRDDDTGTDSGSAYVFVRSGSSWSQQAKLLGSDSGTHDFFGWDVSVAGDIALIGAPLSYHQEVRGGSVYVFRRNGNSWAQQTKLVADDGVTYDYFGYSVSLSGTTALIASYKDDDNGNNSGSAYVFNHSSNGWNQVAKLLPADGMFQDYFGVSASLSGDTALIGANEDNDSGTDSGSAYLFDLDLDNDGLFNSTEASIGSDKELADTDADGLSDFDEVNQDGNPRSYTLGIDTDPNNPDTDGDGLLDGVDSQPLIYNPNDNNSVEVPLPFWAYGVLAILLGWIGWAREVTKISL